MQKSILVKKILQEVYKISPRLIEISKEIHAHPELGYQEFTAVKLLTDFLSENGFSIEKGIGGMETAFIARGKNPKNKPHVAFVAEYDALPGLGHACGHNLIGPMSVGAAVALQNIDFPFAGSFSVIGTPAEEGGGGKITLIDKGIFRDVDAAMMIHPSSRTKMIRFMLAVVELKFTFLGKSAHAAAYPHKGINALDGVLLTFNNINALRQQLKSDVRIHGIISEGGSAPNIIPERATARFYVRSIDPKYFEEVMEKVKNCARGAALATQTKLNIEIGHTIYSPFKPNYTLGEIFKENLTLLGLKEDVIKEDEGMGSSDIGNISQIIPTIHADLTICPTKTVIHSPEFARAAVSQKGMLGLINGAKLLALSAADLLTQPQKMEAVRKDFIG